MRTLWKFIFASFLYACHSNGPVKDLGNEQNNHTIEISPTLPPETSNEKAVDSTQLVGIYAGSCWSEEDWSKDRAMLLVWGIDSVVGNRIEGKAVMDGKMIAWDGKLIRDGNHWTAIAGSTENGEWAGSWLVEWDANGKMNGSLSPQNLQKAPRRFSLKRKEVLNGPELELPIHSAALPKLDEEKDTDESITSQVSTLNASKRLLNANELKNVGVYDLKAIRYAIFARKGQIIPDPRMRLYFEGFVNWYLPYEPYSESGLTDIERKNIELLKRYEEVGNRYKPWFGR